MPLTRRHICTGFMTMTLAACGFKPRQPMAYDFKVIYVPPTPSALLTELKRGLLADAHVEVLQDPRQWERANLSLDLLQETREKVVIGRTSTGGVREFQLRLRVRFRVRDKAGIELIPDTEVLQQRDISFIETNVLAKEQEEELLYRNMQTDVVQQILLRLARLRPAGG